jgi:hypothetical protein
MGSSAARVSGGRAVFDEDEVLLRRFPEVDRN